jgi:hypothetical protein
VALLKPFDLIINSSVDENGVVALTGCNRREGVSTDMLVNGCSGLDK